MGRLALLVRADDAPPPRRDTRRAAAGWRIRVGTFAATAAMVSAGLVLGAHPAAAAPAPVRLTSAEATSRILA
ncbi:hypothetical protein ABZX38_11135 [Streptomyces longwoodensis]|uniref:hypothetical protein n=1 Tax=Streptomyces longwoodensis TaxID=68231 RepID=UPI0033BB441C